MKFLLLSIVTFLVLCFPGISQVNVAMEGGPLEFFEREPRKIEEVKGRKALYLNGKALLKTASFADGVLEVDFTASKPRSFAGFIFRAQDDENYEAFYVRLHKSKMPDALQYNPEYNGEANWQLYGEHQNFANFDQQEWNRLRIEFRGSELKVYLNNNSQPVLEVSNLRRGTDPGYIGFYSFLGTYFSNFRYTPFEDVAEAKTLPPAEEGVIQQWELSDAQVAKEVNTQKYPQGLTSNWQKAQAEPSGLLPINKYVRKQNAGNFERNEDEMVWARYTFDAEESTTRKLYFDFSDNIDLFFNGKLIFSGKNGFRFKGLTFRGDIHIEGNAVYLDVQQGKNEILAAVADRANGWAILGKIE